ncbi:MAG: glycosyltransferase family 4 protein [Candidatus Helarchaeota archaeon]
MKICFIGPSLIGIPPVYGGAIETFTFELARALAELKEESIIITRNNGRNFQKIKHLTLEKVSIPSNSLVRGGVYNFKVFLRLFKEKDIQIINTQSTSVFPTVLGVAKLLNMPLIHTEHVYYPWIKIPRTSWIKQIKFPIECGLSSFTAKFAQLILVSNPIMKYILRIRRKIPESKIKIIPQGIDSKQFNYRASSKKVRRYYRVSEDEDLLMYCGRIAPHKNLEVLLKTIFNLIEKKRKIKLLLVGPKNSNFPMAGEFKPPSNYYLKLKRWIETKKLQEFVKFTGSIPYKKIPEYYASCNLFIQPSWYETFGRATFEAAAMGIPFICRRIKEIELDYLPKTSGILLNKMSVKTLEKAIQKILDNKIYFKKRAVKEAQTLHEKYNWLKIAKDYRILYREMLN